MSLYRARPLRLGQVQGDAGERLRLNVEKTYEVGLLEQGQWLHNGSRGPDAEALMVQATAAQSTAPATVGMPLLASRRVISRSSRPSPHRSVKALGGLTRISPGDWARRFDADNPKEDRELGGLRGSPQPGPS
jgi:hypothetical protein